MPFLVYLFAITVKRTFPRLIRPPCCTGAIYLSAGCCVKCDGWMQCTAEWVWASACRQSIELSIKQLTKHLYVDFNLNEVPTYSSSQQISRNKLGLHRTYRTPKIVV